ncbi:MULTISPECIES: ribosome recycling factor [Bifidobacterium]|uniref:Ribosome-recycling factor n=2 Tax=Bifidobacterium coryneforme TaxID=1687 RepID=A0A087VU36_9BIFI|nr:MULTISPECIES: ribosome recycling factor [Bifidobacterium]MCT6877748.1 ribosome recycling factor [Bifidobacteriales bacterium]AIC91841.1 ribosome recycling factor [Bifidobacterium indicum LMG 11587 = DSM 20214]AII74636.1 Ribosome Recycling Factor (RRF) [Bifidobacterium coryneforme]KJY53261.1 Ribosome-recycling factor [Bifidobacterium coryneforme]MBH9978896.1 ribosome recycling factor [Bifidobacterium sp. W8108]
MTTVVDQAKDQMDKTIEATKENFAGIRTGRANPSFLNDIMVDYYGAPTPIKALASIGVPEPRTLAVTPFDASQAGAVEKAIRDSDLGVNPNRDGNVIRVTMPELTEDRRRDYVKIAKTKAEEGKVAVRNIRRKVKEDLEAKVKDGDLGEDEGNRLQKELETVTKQKSDTIDQLLEAKEKEILEV